MGLFGGNAKARVHIDTSRWPVLIITPPPTPLSDAILDDFVTEWTARTSGRSGQYVCINHLTGVPPMSARHRKKMTDWMNASRAGLAAHCCGTAFVFDSALMRAALTAVLWMFSPPYPTQVFRSLDEAIAWAEQRARDAAVDHR